MSTKEFIEKYSDKVIREVTQLDMVKHDLTKMEGFISYLNPDWTNRYFLVAAEPGSPLVNYLTNLLGP
jgi:hypothetical protein